MKAPSLRRRVTWLSIAVMAVLLVALAAVTAGLMSQRLDQDLRERLDARAELASTVPMNSDLDDLADRFTDDTIRATISRDGESVAGVQEPPFGPGGPGGPGFEPSLDADEVARLTRTVELDDGTTISLRGNPFDNHRVIAGLVFVEFVVSGVLIAAVALTFRLVARRALAPLDEMAAAARRIAAGERRLRLQPSRVDTDLGGLATSFDTMVDSLDGAVHRAERSEATMRQFLADASHELRNPAAAIGATAERLIHGHHDQAEREALALDVVRESHRLGRLVDDLLDVARLEGPVDRAREPIDLVALLAEEVRRGDRAASRVGATVRLAATPTVAVPPVTGDRAALARTVTNLLDNAVHHAPAGSAVEVGLRVDGPRVIVEDRERIFDRFVRLDEARARDEGGSGLGLSISRAIARSHGGDVRCVDPVSGHGATFELFLPFVNAGTGEGREDDHSSGAGHGA